MSDAGLATDAWDGAQHARGVDRVVQGLFSLHEHGSVVPPGRLRGLDREQDAALGIDGEVRLRGGGKLARGRQARVVSRLAAQHEREHGED